MHTCFIVIKISRNLRNENKEVGEINRLKVKHE